MIEMGPQVLSAREFRSAKALDDDSLVAGNTFLGGKRVENLKDVINVDVGSETDSRLVRPKTPHKDHHDICRTENEGNEPSPPTTRVDPLTLQGGRGGRPGGRSRHEALRVPEQGDLRSG